VNRHTNNVRLGFKTILGLDTRMMEGAAFRWKESEDPHVLAHLGGELHAEAPGGVDSLAACEICEQLLGYYPVMLVANKQRATAQVAALWAAHVNGELGLGANWVVCPRLDNLDDGKVPRAFPRSTSVWGKQRHILDV
jgi:hypothetical protein